EAPVLEEGAGLAWLPAADKSLVFSDPQSLSFGELNLAAGTTSKQLMLTVSDAGGGDGTWQVQLPSQSPSPRPSLDVPPTPFRGGVARRLADAVAGAGRDGDPERDGKGRDGARGRLRLPPPPSRQRRQADPLRLLRHPAGARERDRDAAAHDASRRHPQGREP